MAVASLSCFRLLWILLISNSALAFLTAGKARRAAQHGDGAVTNTRAPFTARSASRLSLSSFWEQLQDQVTAILPEKGMDTTKASTYPKVTVPEDFVVPEPRPLTVPPDTDWWKLLRSSAALAVRLGTGVFVLGWKIDQISLFDKNNESPSKYALKLGPITVRDSSSVLTSEKKPLQNVILYAYDASPYCKLVRETLNLLDISYDYRPCPGARQSQFSQEMLQQTGRQTVPFLLDPNTNTEMFESSDIIEYLVQTYGPSPDTFDRKALWPLTFRPFAVTTATLSALLLGLPASTRQANARPDNEQMQPLQLWAYECSPFCRPVFEKLCGLCLPHTVISCSRGSANRDALVQLTEGRQFQVPYLVDPNTGVALFESTAIVEYLERVYTL